MVLNPDSIGDLVSVFVSRFKFGPSKLHIIKHLPYLYSWPPHSILTVFGQLHAICSDRMRYHYEYNMLRNWFDHERGWPNHMHGYGERKNGSSPQDYNTSNFSIDLLLAVSQHHMEYFYCDLLNLRWKSAGLFSAHELLIWSLRYTWMHCKRS